MKKPREIALPNLTDITFKAAMDIAKAASGKTNEQVAEEMEVGVETVRRWFTDPTYHPSPWRLPRLCDVLGNTIIVQWISANSGGCHFDECADIADGSIAVQGARLVREFSDVLDSDGKAMADGTYNPDELARLEKELRDLVQQGGRMVRMVRKRRGLK